MNGMAQRKNADFSLFWTNLNRGRNERIPPSIEVELKKEGKSRQSGCFRGILQIALDVHPVRFLA
jgi:hypothetical protein